MNTALLKKFMLIFFQQKHSVSVVFVHVLTFILSSCQTEPIEGGFVLISRVGQVQPDNLSKF